MLLPIWYDLSDVKLEALDDRASSRRFCGFSATEATPERTALVRFRWLLVAGQMDRSLFETVTAQRKSKAVTVKTGTLLDVTIITSASEGDANARWAKNEGKPAVHGYKATGTPVPIGATNLIVRDFTGDKWRGRHMTGEPWSQRDFIEKFGIIRAHAAAQAREQGNEDLAERLEGLEFRDARRACVTRLANLGMSVPTIAAITGHRIKTVERIIETYLVRIAAQAGRGIVALLGAERALKERKDGQA
ncbi:transposase [Sphingomonas azotifigens]|uniref:transposase n=1 Tax=Sphingomonas azotifigens TaxID=330920 RepID=UPI001C3FC307|nr:transposase [Sphingomonas azotifigens]